ncbi:DNA import protein CedA1 [Stetteria hydrogenophila]
MPVDTLIDFINGVTHKITALAWALFLLTWSIGWTLRGVPIPFSRLKRIGGSLVEDSVWAAFWLAVGSTVFSIVTYIASLLSKGGG